MADSPTYAYVRRSDSRIHSVVSTAKLEASRCAPAGTDLVDITKLECVPDVGDEITVDDSGCAVAVLAYEDVD